MMGKQDILQPNFCELAAICRIRQKNSYYLKVFSHAHLLIFSFGFCPCSPPHIPKLLSAKSFIRIFYASSQYSFYHFRYVPPLPFANDHVFYAGQTPSTFLVTRFCLPQSCILKGSEVAFTSDLPASNSYISLAFWISSFNWSSGI